MDMTLDEMIDSGRFGAGHDPVYLANLFLRLMRDLKSCSKPPSEIPQEMRDAFTMGGRVPVRYVYRDDTILRIVSERDPEEIKKLSRPVYGKSEIEDLIVKVRKGHTFHYGKTDTWLYQALRDFPIEGLQVGVIGSGAPLYEAVTLAFGGRPITVEYQPRISDHPDLTFLSPDQFARSDLQLDAALCISSHEHDGLGRYGDPLDPDGDLKAMQNLHAKMKPGNRLFLSVPNSEDVLCWNVNRIYGPLRMPLLLEGWRCLGLYGPTHDVLVSLDPFEINAEAWLSQSRDSPEWVFVLEPR